MPVNGTSKARIIVSLPPRSFFAGNDRQNAEDLIRSLRELYPNVFVFDVGIYLGDSRTEAETLIDDAKAFNADLAIGFPNASYVLMLDEKRRRLKYEPPSTLSALRRWLGGTTPENVFADVLNVPTILLWDHILTQPSYPIFGWLPFSLSAAKYGALARLRRGLANPRFRHFIPDSGHIAALEELGILPRHIHRYVVPAHTAFLVEEPASDGRNTNSILFAGNLNADSRDQFELAERALIGELKYEM
ncbi:MAG TPA: hypothetical protein VEC14_05745, partial [Reyranellaceae bacterium]|nr:hypothetical protein [Reyranellaceae bacterium]